MRQRPLSLRLPATTAAAILPLLSWFGSVGCRSAVVTQPNDPNTQTVVTVEQRPTTNPTDKHLIVRDKRD